MRTSVLARISNVLCIGWPGRMNKPSTASTSRGADDLDANGKDNPAAGAAVGAERGPQLGDRAVR